MLSSGEVALCCLGYAGRALLGRVDDDTSIEEVWNGPAYRRVRAMHRTAQQDAIDLCRQCTKAFLVAAEAPPEPEQSDHRRAA